MFPNRNRSKTASFERLGAFVISSRLKNGEVRYVHLVSEKGRPCTLENPWPGKAARITRNGKGAELLEGARLHFRTKENEGNRIAGAAIH